jgi:hypothetical protein
VRCLGWGQDGRREARAGCPWWLSDGEHGSVRSSTGAVKRWRRKKRGGGGCSTVVCSLDSRQRRWKVAAQATGTVGGKRRQ